MLKHRVIPVLLTDGTMAVKTRCFRKPGRKVGTMVQHLQVMESRNIDELIILDIFASKENREPHYSKLSSLTKDLFCPCTIGGGIISIAHIEKLLRSGADKVVIGRKSFDYKFIKEAAKKFGSQCIVAAVDSITTPICKESDFPMHKVYSEDQSSSGILTYTHIENLTDSGVGEILLTSVDREGTRTGYDLNLIKAMTNRFKIPIVANGGCGAFKDMANALEAGANAVAASSMFLFTPIVPMHCSMYLDNHGYKTRVETVD